MGDLQFDVSPADTDASAQDAFSWRTAHSLAVASRLSYRDVDAIGRVVREVWGFPEYRYLESGEDQGFLAADDRVVVVVFRGTDSVTDWLSNLSVSPTQQEYGRVHGGFRDGYRAVHDQLLAALGEVNPHGLLPVMLAGHSRGAAIAAVACVELASHAVLAGCYTYGQPRVGDETMRANVDAAIRGRFYRFVNDADLVTRVPPGYVHTGQPIRFDGDGNVVADQRGAFASVEGIEGVESATGVEPDPVTESEFEQVQLDASAVNDAAGATVEGAYDGNADATLEGLIPGIADHRIDRYVAAIRRQLESDGVEWLLGRESAFTRASGDSSPDALEAGVGGRQLAASAALPVLLRLKRDNPAWEPPAGMTILTRTGPFFTGTATATQIEQLRTDTEVVSVTASREGGVVERATDGVRHANGDQLHVPPLDERGDRALVGIVDTGIDVLHEAFLGGAPEGGGASGTRIHVIWNQRDPTGPSPQSLDPGVFSEAAFAAGTVYVESDINQMVSGAKPTPVALRDPHQHGTFVASVAAGRATGAAAGEFSGGMAPDAPIAVVMPDMQTEQGAPTSIG